MNVLISLLKRAAAALPDYDAEIVELHHKWKRDAPSGTALLWRIRSKGRAVAKAICGLDDRE